MRWEPHLSQGYDNETIMRSRVPNRLHKFGVRNSMIYNQLINNILHTRWFPTSCKGTRILGLCTVQTLNRSTFGAKRLRLQANGGFCRRVPPPRVLTKEKAMNICAKEIPGTAPTLNRSTWSEAKAPSGARPGRVFDDEGGKYGKANRPRGCMRGQSPLY